MLGHLPCKLCIYQRFPYIVSIFLILNILLLKKYIRPTLLVLSFVSLIGSLIASYHFGIEQGFFNESLVCEAENLNQSMSKEEILKQLQRNTISCKEVTFSFFGFSLASINAFFLSFYSIYLLEFIKIMKSTNKKTLEEIIRVDHAGERGAIKIYEGQLLALNTFKKNEKLKKLIEGMKEHEKEHFEYFDKEIQKRNIKPTVFLPIWDLLGVTLGFGTTMLGEKAAMLCTASVEEVIDGHYKSQLDKLGDDEKDLKKSISKFRDDEIDHKNIAYDKVQLNKVCIIY